MSERQELTLISGGLARAAPGASAVPVRHILWTGGWDSTFRVLSLLATDTTLIQPHYIANPARQSQALEIDAMARIRRRATERWGPRLLEPRIVPLEEITVSDEAREAYRQLTRHYQIGPQYLWLAAYARSIGAAMELCIHADDRATGIAAALQQRAAGGEAMMGGAGGLFGEHFTFPLLALSKLRMSAEAERLGFRDLMDLTWFCQIPSSRGVPCGFCNPCRWTIEEGLGRRVPPGRRFRLAIYRHLIRKLPGFRVREALRKRLMR